MNQSRLPARRPARVDTSSTFEEMQKRAIEALVVWAAHDEAGRETCAMETMDRALRPAARALLQRARWLNGLGRNVFAREGDE